MTLADYLVTRTVELVVHTDDLNAAVPGLDIPYDRQALAACTRLLADALAAKAPGASTEVRIPPYAVVQCVEGPRHTRGTPPNVVETDPLTWIRLATGRMAWQDALARPRSARAENGRTWADCCRSWAEPRNRGRAARPGPIGRQAEPANQSRSLPSHRHEHTRHPRLDKQRLAALAAPTLLPLAAACGSEDAGSESVGSGASASVTGATGRSTT